MFLASIFNPTIEDIITVADVGYIKAVNFSITNNKRLLNRFRFCCFPHSEQIFFIVR